MYGHGHEYAQDGPPYFSFVPQNDENWTHDPILRSVPANSPPLSMQRFLDDQEGLPFAPQQGHYYATDNSFPCVEFPSPYLVPSVPRMVSYAHQIHERSSSPSASGPASLYSISSWGDRQTTPMSSPPPSIQAFSPEIPNLDMVPFPHGGQSVMRDDKPVSPCSGNALHDAQAYADALFEKDAYEEDLAVAYFSSYDGGYQPMHVDDQPSEAFQRTVPAVANSTRGSESPNIRKRRPQPSHAVTAPNGSSKVTKRTKGKKRSNSQQSKSSSDQYHIHTESNSNRAFPCPLGIYGCPSTFGSKNEWKRHVNTQHIRLGFWRCDQCDQVERKPNDFNRKDLFIQHIRRMHSYEKTRITNKPKSATSKSGNKRCDPEDQALAAAAARCFKEIRRSPDDTGCYFCDHTFCGAGTWDERLEHIGRHLENAKKDNEERADPHAWPKDQAMEDWLKEQGIIKQAETGWTLA